MSRRKAAPKRKILPDPKFGNLKVAKFMNQIMTDGKKSVAEKIIYGAFDEISKKSDKEPVEVFEKALEEVGPMVEVKARRVGGSTYQVPIEIRAYRGTNVSLKWITEFARGRSGKNMSIKLSNEIIDAAKEAGNSIRRKEQTHKMAEANKAFAHFRY